MVACHFDISRVKAALNAKSELKKANENTSFSEKLKDEAEQLQRLSMDTVYKFYTEGVLGNIML